MTGESGANWSVAFSRERRFRYEGLYGYKTGWAVPIVQSLGIEGGGGTQVSIPIKEGQLGRPISVCPLMERTLQITKGYHVGPFVGLADHVGVDWLNGGVSFNEGFALPLVGVGVSTGTSVGFPSIGAVLNRMGIDPAQVGLDASSARTAPG